MRELPPLMLKLLDPIHCPSSYLAGLETFLRA